jgi:hypothetical protein
MFAGHDVSCPYEGKDKGKGKGKSKGKGKGKGKGRSSFRAASGQIMGLRSRWCRPGGLIRFWGRGFAR